MEVGEQVTRAAKEARHKLNKLRPDTRVGKTCHYEITFKTFSIVVFLNDLQT